MEAGYGARKLGMLVFLWQVEFPIREAFGLSIIVLTITVA